MLIFYKVCFRFSFQIYILICIFMAVISLQNSKAEKYGLGFDLNLLPHCNMAQQISVFFFFFKHMYAFFELFSLDFSLD